MTDKLLFCITSVFVNDGYNNVCFGPFIQDSEEVKSFQYLNNRSKGYYLPTRIVRSAFQIKQDLDVLYQNTFIKTDLFIFVISFTDRPELVIIDNLSDGTNRVRGAQAISNKHSIVNIKINRLYWDTTFTF